MAILGYNTEGTWSTINEAAGRKVSSKFTLAGAAILQELHAWVHPPPTGSAVNSFVIHIYADSSGSPGARVAYTGLLGPYSTAGGAIMEISQAGFSTALAAGDYWLGLTFNGAGTGGGSVPYDTGGTHAQISSGAAVSPPSDPWGSPGTTGTNKISVWAVIGTAGPPVANFTGTPLSGTAPMAVVFTDTTTSSPTSWAWTFGDGGTSTAQNPTHTYTIAGVYTVTLVATNASGSDTKTRTGYVAVAEPIVYAAGGGITIY